MKKIALLLISLALPGSALAFNKFINETNNACGYEVVTDCTGCHDASGDYKIDTFEKDLYLTEGACGFCTENTACNVAPPTVDELYDLARNTVTLDYFEDIFGQFIQHLGASKKAVADDPDLTDPFAHVFPACPELAAKIGSDHSRLTGNLVRRVTMKTRNQRNIPDAWELEQLLKFEQMAADGDPRDPLVVADPRLAINPNGILKTMEFEASEVVTESVGKGKNKVEKHYYRYMRSLTMPPLPNGGDVGDDGNPQLPCLKCHGTGAEVSQGVRDAIGVFYPYDTSMGYKPGDIRGAWTVKIPLTAVPE